MLNSRFRFRIIFVFVFGPKNSIRSPLINVTSFPLYVYNPHHPRPHLRFLRSTLASSEQILWSGPNSLFTCYFVGKSITWSFAKDLYFYAFFSYHLFPQLGESVFRKHFSTCYLFDFIAHWQYWKGEIKDDTFSNNAPRPHWPPWLVCLFSALPLSPPRESGQTNILGGICNFVPNIVHFWNSF